MLAQLHALVLAGETPGRAARLVASRDQVHPTSQLVQVRLRTLRRWRAAYEQGGLVALEPRSRKRTTTSLALSQSLVTFFRDEKTRDPRASVPELIRRADPPTPGRRHRPRRRPRPRPPPPRS